MVESGYLDDINDWNTNIPKYLAAIEGITMSDQYCGAVNFLSLYYVQYRIAPMIKILV